MTHTTRLLLRFILTVPPPPRRWAWYYPSVPYADTYARYRTRFIRHRQHHYQSFAHRHQHYFLIQKKQQ